MIQILTMESNHDKHDRKWMFNVATSGGGSTRGDQMSCLACIVEILEDPDVLVIKKKSVLNQLVAILNSCSVQCTQLLQSDIRITLHVALILLGEYSVHMEHVPLPLA